MKKTLVPKTAPALYRNWIQGGNSTSCSSVRAAPPAYLSAKEPAWRFRQ